MKTELYSILDNVISSFSPMFQAANDQAAIREIGQAVRHGETQLSSNPEDFHVYHVGSYDHNTGALVNLENRLVAKVKDIAVAVLGPGFIEKGFEPDPPSQAE